jgi:hypothetical protein
LAVQHLYRDAHFGIRARLEELAAPVLAREAELTEAFWASLEPYVRERLAELRSGLDLACTESLDDLTRAEGLLSAYVDELEHWIARAPQLEQAWLELPDEVADPPPLLESGPHLSAPDGEAFTQAFATAVRDAAPGATIVEDGWWSCLARFRFRNAPFALRASALPSGNGNLGEVAMRLVTSVARAAPKMFVRHESLVAAVSKAMGFKHEVEVGDASFDGLFFIQASKRDAARLLVPNVRTHLMTLARFDVPTFEIDPERRLASLTWFFEPAKEAIDSAMRALALVRETPSEICFRR